MCNLICKFCGDNFVWGSTQKQYCSNECKQKAKENRPKEQNENVCVLCNKPFTSVKKGTMYCSNACRVKSSKDNNKREYLHECLNCKIEFMSMSKITKFCSLSCAGVFKNRNGNGNVAKCKQCHNDFNQKHDRHYFCCQKCKTRYATENKILDHTVNCSNCNKEIKRTKQGASKSKDFFCCRACESQFREKNSADTRICEFCKKDFNCKKGEKLRFCSMGCQSEWQKTTGFGKNHPSYKHEITDEMRTKTCECCGKEMRGTPISFKTNKYCSYSCKTKSMPKSMSFPHIETIRVLDELGISNGIEKQVGRYSVDSYIENSNLCIEVMGTFWHCDNRKYPNPIGKIQERSVKRDKKKNLKIKEKDLIVLYIWEDDINKDYEVCKKLIMEFIKDNGKLNNYHSMNYYIEKDELKLRSEILIPFFER